MRGKLGGAGLCFSPDSRLVAVLDSSKIVQLVEAETGRVVARLESPEPSDVIWATFSPDGSRLVLVPGNAQAIHVWDLRTVRKRLVAMGLDWDARRPHPDDAPSAFSLPPARVRSQDRCRRSSGVDSAGDGRDSRTTASTSGPRPTRLPKRSKSDNGRISGRYSSMTRPGNSPTAPNRTATQSQRCTWPVACRRELSAGDTSFLNTLGMTEYRVGQYSKCIAILSRSMEARKGQTTPLALFFMAMARSQTGPP